MNAKFGDSASVSLDRQLLVQLASQVLKSQVDPELPLVSQGLDSLGAAELLEHLQELGFDVEYELLLDHVNIDCLIETLREKSDDGPTPLPETDSQSPTALLAPQVLWAELESETWGAWANISLCLSMPASCIRATFLPAIAQSLCDANEAMQMVMVRTKHDDGFVVQQRLLPNFQLPVEMRDAPESERDALRLMEAFESKESSPFEPSTRALVLSSPETNGRHWLCITMHHVFSDRISMHSLARQVREMITTDNLRVADPPKIGYLDFAIWQNRKRETVGAGRQNEDLQALLSGAKTSDCRPVPHIAKDELRALGDLPPEAHLRPPATKVLERLAVRLETTVPLLLHALSSVLIARLIGDEDILLCHVVSNRERYPMAKNMVGCLDTSVPVAVNLSSTETLKSLCQKTQRAFLAAQRCTLDLPRGSWIDQSGGAGVGNTCFPALIERFPHINIVRSPEKDIRHDAADIREHPVRRVQKTRWGLLLRATLPQGGSLASGAEEPLGIEFRAFAEDRALAGVVPYCLVDLLERLLAETETRVEDLLVRDEIDRMIDRVVFAAAQVRRTSALVEHATGSEPFIYEKLINRQRRWYEHNAQYELCRDASNRFVGTAANPFPFTQLDKLKERLFLEENGVPQSKLLHILPKEGLRPSLIDLAPELPDSFVIKPVGAGHSFGVTLVRNGLDLSRGGVPFNPEIVGAELSAMAQRGYCQHEGKVFPFNFSSFLIEEFVIDERGFAAPTDYKVFMIGERFLWLQLHFKEDGFNWVAFLDADFRLLGQPAWDPTTCWRTHRALVCTDQAMVDARRPACLAKILEHSSRLAAHMGIFCRLDWYADKTRGPLMGEITNFPHMLQPRSFYSSWANDLVKSVWQEPDGAASNIQSSGDEAHANAIGHAQALLDADGPSEIGIEDFVPPASRAVWSVEDSITYAILRNYVASFDLAQWGVASGDHVALLVENGVQLAALLAATMNRYIAVPIDSALPAGQVAAQIEQSGIKTLVVVAGSREARKVHDISQRDSGLSIIELTPNSAFALASLPSRRPALEAPDATPTNGLDDDVLLLRTSGSTGEPKGVYFSLARLMRSGAMIGASLELSHRDVGVSMLPLTHVGGIACNLIAPLLAHGCMHHARVFDPKIFFRSLEGPQGATWCYLVPSMWDMVLDYARMHPEFRAARPWPRLRAVRSAGAELPQKTANDLAELFGDRVAVLPTYGMTEAMPISAPPVSYRLERQGSVGRVLPSVSVEIVDHTNEESLPSVANGIVGEVTVSGPCVFDGYARGSGTVTDIFTPRGYFRTGDLGCLTADGSGWLRVDGRIKDTINSGGETIAPAEVEALMREFPDWSGGGQNTQLMAFSRAHADLAEDVALAVVGVPTDTGFSEIYRWALTELPAAMVPKTLVHISKLPMSGAGKLTRARFAERFNANSQPGRLGSLQTYIWSGGERAPRLIEEKSSSCFQGKLPLDTNEVSLNKLLELIQEYSDGQLEIGADISFDDAGVNSLAAVELSIYLSERLKIDLPTWVLSDNPTPRALCSVIAGLKGEQSNAVSQSAPARIDAPVHSGIHTKRMLFLHGEGADADLMEKSLMATNWVGRLAGQVEFIFMDAPHVCAPMPEFHITAVEAGLYRKPEYASWGATNAKTLKESLLAVAKTIDDFGPIDAIGGICDGALVAALTALRRPEIQLFLGISPGPVSRLDWSWKPKDQSLLCRSIHLVSGADDQHSLSQQLEIAERCETALIIKHESGHAVPRFAGKLERDVLMMIDGAGSGSASVAVAKTQRPASGWQNPSPQHAEKAEKYERVVANLMANVLRQAHVDKAEDFFDAGGDSLKAMALALQLEKKTGLDLPFELLFAEGSSVESLARVIASREEDTTNATVIPLSNSMSDRDIFALPTFDGRLSDYMALSRALATNARLVGVRPEILTTKGTWKRSDGLRDVAQEAAAVISNHTHRQQVDLVGFSAAGILALETARVLVEWGHEIGSLAIIDSDFTSRPGQWPLPLKYLSEWQKHISRRLRGKTNQRKGYRRLHFRSQLSSWNPAPVKINSPVFFKAEFGIVDAQEIEKWRAAIDGELEVVPVSGGHTSFRTSEVADTIADFFRAHTFFDDNQA